MDFSIYSEEYFLRGRESGLSLYGDYSWLPNLTRPFVKRIVEHCHIHEDDTVLDFGCSRGYIVRALREMDIRAFGVDASVWAIENCDETVREYVSHGTAVSRDVDWIIAKDVLEHIPDPDLDATISNLLRHARKGVFVVVPLSPRDGEPYVVPEYEQDVTHAQRLTLFSWMNRLRRHEWCVGGCYLVPGIKQNYSHFEQGNGFLKCIRQEPGEE